tara:strand:- start:3505 stop:3759 length:255 start_codon:yes stop_codon:yes gene_type:complete
MLNKQQIKQLKQQHTSKAVNIFMRFEKARLKHKYLPTNFILSVINNSEPLPVNKNITRRTKRTYKRQTQKFLVNSSIASNTRKQ